MYPLYYAVNSLSAINLKTLLQSFDVSVSHTDNELIKIHHATIINQKQEGGNNYLHTLINQLTKKNFKNVSEMIKVLVTHKCNPNLKNDQLETPFVLLVKKAKVLSLDNELLDFFISNMTIDAGFTTTDDVMRMLVERELHNRFSGKISPTKDFHFMSGLIEQFDEKTFIAEFKNFTAQSQKWQSESSQFLESAVVRNLVEVTNVLVANGACVNGSSDKSEFQMPPALLACFFGHHNVLKALLSDVSLDFVCEKTRQNLLHQICCSLKIHESDRQKCFDLIIADPRCTIELINGPDAHGHSPLHFACLNDFDIFTKELLRRGAYIGHESIIHNIDREVLVEFLDECVKTSSDTRDKDCEVYVNYTFLSTPIAPKLNPSELKPAVLIAKNPRLHDLVLHPVISSFLWFKWKRINFLVYFNLLLYFSFMLFLGCFIINQFHDSIYHFDDEAVDKLNDSIFEKNSSSLNASDDALKVVEVPLLNNKPSILALLFGIEDSIVDEENKSKRAAAESPGTKFEESFYDNAMTYRICFFGVILMTIYQIIQCAKSFPRYFFKITNWFDIALLTLSFAVLLGTFHIDPVNFKRIRAITVLAMAVQVVELLSKFSLISMSLHMAIFKKVCLTFSKTLGLFMVLVLAFSMSFYTVIDSDDTPGITGDEKKSFFVNPFMSIVSTVRMMLSDFNIIELDKEEPFKSMIFLSLVFFMTIVLLNLLTALAINDTNDILQNADLVDTKKRISTLHNYQKIFAFCNIQFMNVFPEMHSIMFQPNKDHVVKVEDNSHSSKTGEVKIFVHIEGKVGNSINVYANKLMFWKKSKDDLKLRKKAVAKFVTIAKRQRQLITEEF